MTKTSIKKRSIVAAGIALGCLLFSFQEKAQALTFQTFTDLKSRETAVGGSRQAVELMHKATELCLTDRDLPNSTDNKLELL